MLGPFLDISFINFRICLLQFAILGQLLCNDGTILRQLGDNVRQFRDIFWSILGVCWDRVETFFEQFWGHFKQMGTILGLRWDRFERMFD